MKIGIKLYYVWPIYEFEQMCVIKLMKTVLNKKFVNLKKVEM